MDLKEYIALVLKNAPGAYASRSFVERSASSYGTKEQINKALDEMISDGLVINKETSVALCERLGIYKGVIVKVAGTFGFVQLLDEEKTQVFIPGRYLRGGMAGEECMVTVHKSQKEGKEGSMEGEIVTLYKNEEQTFVGVFNSTKEGLSITLDCMPKVSLRVWESSAKTAKNGDKVLVKLVSRTDRHQNHVAAIVSVFGSSDRAKYCADAVLADNGIKIGFDADTQAEADALDKIGVDPKEVAKRLDLRDKIIVTIDSKETKDIDDAVSIEKDGDDILLGVHIADVSHYVRPGTALDNEAFERGTSVYYANSVVPMLPVQLSNGLCSLNEKEDRLALSCMMRLDKNGNMISYKFAKTVLHSKKKCAYSDVNAILDGSASPEILGEYADVIPTLKLMGEYAMVLKKARFERGAMNIETKEAKIITDSEGDPIDIVCRTRGESEEMIEEYMLMANQAAARFGRENEIPYLYRVHEDPDAFKLENLAGILKVFGYPYLDIKPGVTPKTMSSLLDLSRGKPEQILIHKMILRSMAKAKYFDEPLGHYGIAMKDYSHFTSPIRRYPDLSIHRIISDFLSGTDKKEIVGKYKNFVHEAAEHSTKMEISAMRAERSVDDCYKAQYMAGFLFDEFDGTVSGVTQYGFYVELDNTCEGLIRLINLKDKYELIDDVRLVGETSGKSIGIGDRIRVKVTGANVNLGQVDFELVES